MDPLASAAFTSISWSTIQLESRTGKIVRGYGISTLIAGTILAPSQTLFLMNLLRTDMNSRRDLRRAWYTKSKCRCCILHMVACILDSLSMIHGLLPLSHCQYSY